MNALVRAVFIQQDQRPLTSPSRRTTGYRQRRAQWYSFFCVIDETLQSLVETESLPSKLCKLQVGTSNSALGRVGALGGVEMTESLMLELSPNSGRGLLAHTWLRVVTYAIRKDGDQSCYLRRCESNAVFIDIDWLQLTL